MVGTELQEGTVICLDPKPLPASNQHHSLVFQLPNNPPQLRRSFDALDHDHDGFITSAGACAASTLTLNPTLKPSRLMHEAMHAGAEYVTALHNLPRGVADVLLDLYCVCVGGGKTRGKQGSPMRCPSLAARVICQINKTPTSKTLNPKSIKPKQSSLFRLTHLTGSDLLSLQQQLLGQHHITKELAEEMMSEVSSCISDAHDGKMDYQEVRDH